MLDLEAPPAGLKARRLAAQDSAACAALSAEAGWNQTARDWEFMIGFGGGAGLFADRLVGTAVALPYDGTIGFVSMVLVTPAWQRRGLAHWLTERCLRGLERQGRTPVLDATPAGQGVYRKLGFADGIALDRWRAAAVQDRRIAADRAPLPAGVVLRPATSLAPLVAKDAQAFGAARTPLLGHLLVRRPDLAWVACAGEDLAGFVLGRDGRTATQIGPLVADDDPVAAALLAHVLGRVVGPAIVDLLRGHDRSSALLAEAGFSPVRPFTRMYRGKAEPVAATLVAAAGPEFG